MIEKILTEHKGQKLSIVYDGEKFAIIEEWDARHGYGGKWVIILNPREAHEAMLFIEKHNNRHKTGVIRRQLAKFRGNIIGAVEM